MITLVFRINSKLHRLKFVSKNEEKVVKIELLVGQQSGLTVSSSWYCSLWIQTYNGQSGGLLEHSIIIMITKRLANNSGIGSCGQHMQSFTFWLQYTLVRSNLRSFGSERCILLVESQLVSVDLCDNAIFPEAIHCESIRRPGNAFIRRKTVTAEVVTVRSLRRQGASRSGCRPKSHRVPIDRALSGRSSCRRD